RKRADLAEQFFLPLHLPVEGGAKLLHRGEERIVALLNFVGAGTADREVLIRHGGSAAGADLADDRPAIAVRAGALGLLVGFKVLERRLAAADALLHPFNKAHEGPLCRIDIISDGSVQWLLSGNDE